MHLVLHWKITFFGIWSSASKKLQYMFTKWAIKNGEKLSFNEILRTYQAWLYTCATCMQGVITKVLCILYGPFFDEWIEKKEKLITY